MDVRQVLDKVPENKTAAPEFWDGRCYLSLSLLKTTYFCDIMLPPLSFRRIKFRAEPALNHSIWPSL